MSDTGLRLISRSWRWARVAGGLGALVLIAAAVVVVVIVTRHNTAQAAAHRPDPAGATTVQRRDLVETDTESGTLSYNYPQTVYNNLSGTITWLPQVGPGDQAGSRVLQGRRPTRASDERDHAGLPGPERLGYARVRYQGAQS